MAADKGLNYLHLMKSLRQTVILLLLTVLTVTPQLAVTAPIPVSGEPCGVHAVVMEGEKMAMSDRHCYKVEKCLGGCQGIGCGCCSHFALPVVASLGKTNAIFIQYQHHPIHYVSLNPSPESPPPRHLSC